MEVLTVTQPESVGLAELGEGDTRNALAVEGDPSVRRVGVKASARRTCPFELDVQSAAGALARARVI